MCVQVCHNSPKCTIKMSAFYHVLYGNEIDLKSTNKERKGHKVAKLVQRYTSANC